MIEDTTKTKTISIVLLLPAVKAKKKKTLKQGVWIISSNWVINSGRTHCCGVLSFSHYTLLLLVGEISLELLSSNQVTKRSKLE